MLQALAIPSGPMVRVIEPVVPMAYSMIRTFASSSRPAVRSSQPARRSMHSTPGFAQAMSRSETPLGTGRIRSIRSAPVIARQFSTNPTITSQVHRIKTDLVRQAQRRKYHQEPHNEPPKVKQEDSVAFLDFVVTTTCMLVVSGLLMVGYTYVDTVWYTHRDTKDSREEKREVEVRRKYREALEGKDAAEIDALLRGFDAGQHVSRRSSRSIL